MPHLLQVVSLGFMILHVFGCPVPMRHQYKKTFANTGGRADRTLSLLRLSELVLALAIGIVCGKWDL